MDNSPIDYVMPIFFTEQLNFVHLKETMNFVSQPQSSMTGIVCNTGNFPINVGLIDFFSKTKSSTRRAPMPSLADDAKSVPVV